MATTRTARERMIDRLWSAKHLVDPQRILWNSEIEHIREVLIETVRYLSEEHAADDDDEDLDYYSEPGEAEEYCPFGN
jgi:hypothetical protein